MSLQRAEWLYRALETLSVTVMGIAVYLSVFSGRLCRRILENGRAMGDIGSVLRFSQALRYPAAAGAGREMGGRV